MNDSSNFGLLLFCTLLVVALVVPCFVGMWKTFAKAGKPGWASIVPVYNVVVMIQIAGLPMWWVLMFFIPLANFVAAAVILVSFAKAFGKGVAFAIGLWFLPMIFYPVLGFGDSRYQGGAAAA